MIHHPSFYGLPSSKAVLPLQKPQKQPETRTIIYDKHVLNAILKSSDTPIHDWKISMEEIFQKFEFDIDYDKFIQWCQVNLLLPLIKLDEEEIQFIKNGSHKEEFYVYQHNLDRCIELLNDLKRGSISMTLLPIPSNIETDEQQTCTVKSPLAGIYYKSDKKLFFSHLKFSSDSCFILLNAILFFPNVILNKKQPKNNYV